MDIVVFGASGRVGSAIVEEALRRKHDVTAAVRRPEAFGIQHERLQVVAADVLDPASVAAAVRGHGEVISAFGPAAGQENDLLKAAESLLEGLRTAGVERLIVVGGAGSLAGRRTGQFRIGLDRLIVDEDGRSSISIEDFAVAVVDELEEGNFSRARFTVGY